MVWRKEIHNVIEMIYCYYIHPPFERCHWLLSPCQSLDGGGRVAGQLQAKPRGGAAGAHQLHCSVLRMQRSEVKRGAHKMGGWKSKFKRLSFQFRLRQWSAVNYWSPSMVTMQCVSGCCVNPLSIDNSIYQYFVRVEWTWKEIMMSFNFLVQIQEPELLC